MQPIRIPITSGGMPDVLSRFGADEILMPQMAEDMVPTTSVFNRLLDAVETQGIPVTAAQPGLAYDLGSGAKLTVLAPLQDYDDLNNYSGGVPPGLRGNLLFVYGRRGKTGRAGFDQRGDPAAGGCAQSRASRAATPRRAMCF